MTESILLFPNLGTRLGISYAGGSLGPKRPRTQPPEAILYSYFNPQRPKTRGLYSLSHAHPSRVKVGEPQHWDRGDPPGEGPELPVCSFLLVYVVGLQGQKCYPAAACRYFFLRFLSPAPAGDNCTDGDDIKKEDNEESDDDDDADDSDNDDHNQDSNYEENDDYDGDDDEDEDEAVEEEGDEDDGDEVPEMGKITGILMRSRP
ncbi:hypothetical protein TWF106_006759 [Orbilia oligospora]|uniref:Uncharacterized protein n=1 Tax=Orbilia oligospora TaxID=2813651 RepID=A0A7C8V049_ORBOL|nr:hypothetical protein TWF106_006759 [Orbilia oligospora]